MKKENNLNESEETARTTPMSKAQTPSKAANDDYYTTVEINKPVHDIPRLSISETTPDNPFESPTKPSVYNMDRRDEQLRDSSITIVAEDNKQQHNHYLLSEPSKEVLLDGQSMISEDEYLANSIDDDKDQSFNWDQESDEEDEDGRLTHASYPTEGKNTQRPFKRVRSVYNKYCCWNYLSHFMKQVIIAVIGSSLFITAAVCVYIFLPRPTFLDEVDPNFTNVRSNVQVWLYWAAFMWGISWITVFVIEAVPIVVSKWCKTFLGRRSERVKTNMEYYMNLKWYIGLLIIMAWNWGAWAFLTTIPFSSVQKQPYTGIVWRVFACFFTASILLMVQKTIIQVIANRFHRFAFKDRLQANRRAIKILDRLGKAENRHRPTLAGTKIRNRKSHAISNNFSTTDLRDITQGQSTSVAPSINTDYYATQHSNSSSSDLFYTFKRNLRKAIVNDQKSYHRGKHGRDINSIEYARKNAKKLYISLAYPDGTVLPEDKEARRCLLLSDFEPYFKTAQEAKEAFQIFDRDGNGDITRREFRDTVLHIYRERKDIAISMRDTTQALGKIDLMLLCVSFFALLLIAFGVFQINIWQALVPIGSLLLALTFVFGNSAKNIFESILFLFVTHPYDTGDYVLIDDQFLLVHNMGIMGTKFISAEGKVIYAPTTVLMTKLITNVRRSGSMGEVIQFNIDFRTTTEQFWELHDRLNAWVTSQSRDFGTDFDLRCEDIIDVNQLILKVWLPHKGNWQDLMKRFQRKTRFMLALKDIMTELGIRYELPAQRFTSTALPPDDKTPVFGNPQFMQSTPQSFNDESQASEQRHTFPLPQDPREQQIYEEIKQARLRSSSNHNSIRHANPITSSFNMKSQNTW